MSKQAAVQFLKAIDETPQLKQQIKSQHLEQNQSPENQKKVLDMASKAGYQFTAEEFTAAVKDRSKQRIQAGEISEEDLEKVAGGRGCSWTCLWTCAITEY